MGNPIIGVFADTMSCNKGGFGDVTRQYINAAYISAVEDAGAVPFIIPVSNDLEKTKKLIDLCDGLLFPGGEDIDPGYYGENPHKNLGEIRPEVDKFLFHSLLYALEQRKPALGICKGMQMMVVATGCRSSMRHWEALSIRISIPRERKKPSCTASQGGALMGFIRYRLTKTAVFSRFSKQGRLLPTACTIRASGLLEKAFVSLHTQKMESWKQWKALTDG